MANHPPAALSLHERRKPMHSTHDIDESMVLAARAMIYGLLQRVFSETPDALLHEQERSEIVAEALAVYRSLATPLRACENASALSPYGGPERSAAGSPAHPSLEGEYNRLFVGVGKPAVCVWESVYLTGNSSLFQENTLQVRRFYERFGLQSRDHLRVADDHVAIELAFLRELAIRSSGSEGNVKRRLLSAQLDFLEHHLGKWVGDFADNVIHADITGYYDHYARLLESFVETDRCALASLCESA